MAPVYVLKKGPAYVVPNANKQEIKAAELEIDATQHTPHPVVAVVRWLSSSTYDFADPFGTRNKQIEKDNAQLAEATAKEVTILTPYLTSGNIMSSKSEFIHSMNLTCRDPQNRLIKEIYPGDWIIAFMTPDAETAKLVTGLLNATGSLVPLNDPKFGLKFVGKINSVVKSVSRNPSNGMKDRTLSISSSMFKELGSKVYYDPFYQRDDDHDNLAFLARITGDIDKARSDLIEAINIDSLIPLLFSIFLGYGPSSVDTEISKAKIGQNPRSWNSSYLLPKRIVDFMGAQQQGLFPVYTDFLRYSGGIQHYSAESYTPVNLNKENSKLKIIDSGSFIERTSSPLVGQTNLHVEPFVNESIWNIVNAYLNYPINEMYTTLKMGPEGLIHPYIIARQVPLNTPFAETTLDFDHKEKAEITQFYELPRWVMPAKLVTALQVGRNDAQKANYVEMLFIPGDSEVFNDQSLSNQKAYFPAAVDVLSIKTDGLTTFLQRSPITASQVENNGTTAAAWTKILADRMMSSHLKYTGQIKCKGIYEPICIGDNLEFQGMLFHIESVQHSFMRDPEGHITFDTSMNLTNGLKAYTKDFVYTSEDLWIDFKDFDDTDIAQDGGPTGSVMTEKDIK